MIVPQNNYVLCRRVNQAEHIDQKLGLAYTKKELPLYEVVSVSRSFSADVAVSPGQRIVINSTGTHVIYDDVDFWLVNGQNIAAVIEEDEHGFEQG